MTTTTEDTRVLLQRYRDGELNEQQRRYIEGLLTWNKELAAELAQLDAMGEALRHDTQEQMDAQDFDTLGKNLMERLQADGLVRPPRRAFDWLSGFAWRPWLVPVALAVLVAAGLTFWPRAVPEPQDNGAVLRARLGLNDCVIEYVEAVNSAALVFEAKPASEEDDTMTVIWLFEGGEKRDPS